ncbi:hypothetical protein EZS27_018540 [termite gut metagenome]|uniref:Uncharacterized protein n=1 Tax=termite gut metagenome TaxID=433724 RepID=A0A5J4RI19_9ZZZZ
MQKRIPKYQIKQNLLNVIGSPSQCAAVTTTLKNNDDFNIVSQIVSEIIHSIPTFKKRFWGNIIPKTIKELGGEKMYFYKPKSLKNEINWIILEIKHHQDLIKKFTEIRRIFEHHVLLGEFEKALLLLDNAEKEVGVSIWLYESKFLVYELMDCQERTISLISSINEAKQSKENKLKKLEESGFVTLLLYYLSNRAVKDLSAIKYDEDLFNNFKRNRTDFQKDYYNYYLFRLNYYKHYNIDDPSIPLIMEATNSLIDRYIVLIQVLQAAFIKGDCNDIVLSRSQNLFKLTNDSSLLPFVYIKQPELLHIDYFDIEYIQIIDSYYQGNYRDVISKCKAYIKTDSSKFDILKFYCNSLLYAGNGFSPIFSDSSSPINQICRKIYDTISEKDNSSSLYNLYQLNKNFYGFAIANGLDYFIKEENNFDRSIRLKLLSLNCFDPFFSTIFENEKDALHYLENGLKHIKFSISIEHQKRRTKKEITQQSIVVDYIAETDNAKVLFFNGDYDKSYNVWISILEKKRDCNPITQIAIKFAFDSLIRLEKYQEAIVLFVDEYIKNPIGIKKTDVVSFISLLKKQKYKNIKRIIELPIFVGLNSQQDTDKSFVLQSFCDYYDVKKPSELFDVIMDIEKFKIETFFYVIVNEDVLRHYIYINSTQESLEEKQKILSYLINIKTNNEELYKKMADEVIEELIVYKGTKKMDESKIFANDQAIIKYELKDIEGLYNRFITHYGVFEKGNPIWFIKKYTVPAFGQDATVLTTEVEYTDNGIYQVAYSLYDTIRDKFLFSKFGLGTYLSTRIRHGVLEGELRSDFVANNLVLNKENEKYVYNNYWNLTYGLDTDINANDELFKILSTFSEQIDLLISSFKSDVLQIKIEEKQKGFFDYYIDIETLSYKAIEMGTRTNNSEGFCQLVLKNLWEITERNLQKIRAYIKTDLSNAFHKSLDDLIDKLSVPTFNHVHNEFIQVINDTRTNINQKLFKIEGWFYIQESKFDDFNLEELITIVWESTRKFYPKVNCECQLDLQGSDITIKASYGIHFSDILRIFLTNMFKYSSPNSNKINFKIKTTIENYTVTFTFENDIMQNEKLLNEKFQTLMNAQGRLQLEGGSGLVKAQKIVKYDLDDIENHVNIKAENQKCTAFVRINLQNLIV